MNKDQEVQAYSRAVGKQTLKALAFFFIGIPAVILAIGLTVAYGAKFVVPAALIFAGMLWLYQRLIGKAA